MALFFYTHKHPPPLFFQPTFSFFFSPSPPSCISFSLFSVVWGYRRMPLYVYVYLATLFSYCDNTKANVCLPMIKLNMWKLSFSPSPALDCRPPAMDLTVDDHPSWVLPQYFHQSNFANLAIYHVTSVGFVLWSGPETQLCFLAHFQPLTGLLSTIHSSLFLQNDSSFYVCSPLVARQVAFVFTVASREIETGK